MTILDTYAQRLRWARKRAGLNQTELATHVGMAQRGISKLESGTQTRSASDPEIAAALGVTVAWLRTGQEVGEIAGLERLMEAYQKGGPEARQLLEAMAQQILRSAKSD